jgi:hypothetical protein
MLMIARCYQTEDQARGAFDALINNGFEDKSTVLLTAARDGGESVAPLDVTAAMHAGSVLGEHVGFYASQLEAGLAVVVVGPHFGRSRQAEAILDEYNPLPISHLPPPEPFVPLSERQTPLSSALGMALLSDQATPMSDFWGLNVLSDGRSFLSRLLPELAPNFTLSRLFGMGLLSDNATPMSSLAGISIKSRRLENASSSFGQPLKTNKATPLSSLLNIPLLSKRERFLYQ